MAEHKEVFKQKRAYLENYFIDKTKVTLKL